MVKQTISHILSPDNLEPLLEKARKQQELLTVREVAQCLRVDTTTVRRWVKTGALPAVILPHASERLGYRIRRETLDTVLTPIGGTKC